MSQPSPTPTVPLLTDAAADHRLDQVVGVQFSRGRVFIPTLNAARHAYGVPGRLAPPAARGLRAWIDGTEELRLRLDGFGWKLPRKARLNAAGLIVSPDGETAIALVSGDNATSLVGGRPQVRYARGRVAVEVLQGSLFEEYVAASATTQLWFLLHRLDLKGWRAELALPMDVGRGGWITGWHERIQIVEDRPDKDEVAVEQGPQLPTPIVRWRESA